MNDKVGRKQDPKEKIWIDSIKVLFRPNYKEDDLVAFEIFKCFEYGEDPLCLDEIIDMAKEKGYKEGTILVIAESYTYGYIWRYNNYSEQEWVLVGTTQGIA